MKNFNPDLQNLKHHSIMNQKFLTLITFTFSMIFSSANLFAQTQLSNSSRMLLEEMNLMNSEKFQRSAKAANYVPMTPMKKQGEEYIVSGMMKINNAFDENQLEALGGKTQATVGDVATFRIPMGQFEQMLELSGIQYIQVDTRVNYRLDKAITDTNTDQVHAGTDLPQAFTGAGVIVGVVDIALDMTHPTFRDENGDSRVAAVWIQDNDTGTPPADFSYGTEITDPAQMLAVGQTSAEESHGTHVTSIAAGRGVGADQMFKGMAPDADIVFVQPNLEEGLSSVLDGIAYIFAYAESVGKPAVINLSLGHHNGPHDGTTLSDQFMDGAVGVGKVICGSVSNEGDSPIHIQYEPMNDTISTIIGTIFTGGGAEVSAWGEVGTTFSINFQIQDLAGNMIGETGFFSANTDNEQFFTFQDDNVNLIVSAAAEDMFNQKPSIMAQIQMDESIAEDVFPIMQIKGTSGLVHVWSESLFTSFNNPSLVDGDSEYSCNEIGGVSEGVISVGAHNVRTSFEDLTGMTQTAAGMTEGDITPFSSHGPTVDGRTKPEITAPGDVIIAATNKAYPFLAEAYPTSFEYVEGGETWTFGGASGTSQSAPMVTGIVALLLEANPDLTAAEVKDVLQNTARVDNFTGAIPMGGSQIWGYGKVNALDAVIEVAGMVPTNNLVNTSKPAMVYPNPVMDDIQIAFDDNHKDVSVYLTDASGRVLVSKFIGDVQASSATLETAQLAAGMYFLTIQGDNIFQNEKIIKE